MMRAAARHHILSQNLPFVPDCIAALIDLEPPVREYYSRFISQHHWETGGCCHTSHKSEENISFGGIDSKLPCGPETRTWPHKPPRLCSTRKSVIESHVPAIMTTNSSTT